MNAAAIALVLGSALYLQPRPLAPRDAPARYVQECPSAAAAGSEKCATLRAQTEEVALRVLLAMEAMRRPVPRDFLRQCLRNEMPALQATALRVLGRDSIDAADTAAIVAALDSPYPGVRRAAAKVLPSAPGTASAQAWSKRDYSAVYRSSDRDAGEWVADPVPGAAELGGAPYPGARYVYFASGPRRAFFSTTDPVEKVVASYVKGGTKPMTLAEVKAPKSQAKPDPAEVMRRMQSGEDPMKVVAELQGKAMSQSASSEWTKGIDGAPGVENPRFVEIVQGGVVNGQVRQPRVVIVYRDALLGKTAIVFPRPEAQRSAAMNPDAIQQQILEQQVIAEPAPEFQAIDPTAR